MKRIKKLAVGWIRINSGIGKAGILRNAENDWVEDAACKAFEAGYRQCAEDAAKILIPFAEREYKSFCNRNGPYDPGSLEDFHTMRLAKTIQALPDKEDI